MSRLPVLKLYTCHGSLVGNPILVSNILLSLATFLYALATPTKLCLSKEGYKLTHHATVYKLL